METYKNEQSGHKNRATNTARSSESNALINIEAIIVQIPLNFWICCYKGIRRVDASSSLLISKTYHYSCPVDGSRMMIEFAITLLGTMISSFSEVRRVV